MFTTVSFPTGGTPQPLIPDTRPPESSPAGVFDPELESAPADGLQLGMVLAGRYQLLRRQGQGGMGIVYLARDRNLRRRVAVKLLPASRRSDRRFRRLLRNEARAASRVLHPNVVAFHDWVVPQDGVPFLVMEYVRGRNVRQLIDRKGRLSPRLATRIIAEACRALGAVHEAGLIHRDVKPANLLITRRGVKLADFGLAVALTGSGVVQVEEISGTLCYMSPEQANGEPLDPRSDLFSLGITYFEMLTGVRPDRFGNFPDRAWNIPIPACCTEIVRRATAREPSQRYASAREMLAALKAVLPACCS